VKLKISNFNIKYLTYNLV